MSESTKNEYSWFTKPESPNQPVEWQRVKRNCDVLFIGDNNGNYRGLLKNLFKLGCIEIKFVGNPDDFVGSNEKRPENIIANIDEYELDTREEVERFFRSTQISWTGGNKKLVCLGDILGDRGGQGDLVIQALGLLKGQAKQAGGDIFVTLGNHDVFWLQTLFSGTTFHDTHINKEAASLKELRPFNPTKSQETTYFWDGQTYREQTVDTLNYDQQKVLSSPGVLRHVEIIKRMFSLATVIDDTLFCHSDFDEEAFMKLVTKIEQQHWVEQGSTPSFQNIVDFWNNTFHDSLQKAFPIQNDSLEITKIDKQPFLELFVDESGIGNILCGVDTDKRTLSKKNKKYSAKFEKFLQARGINCLIIGHTTVLDPHNHGKEIDIIPIDAMSDRSAPNNYYSAGEIKKSGEISFFHAINTYTKRTVTP